MSLKNPVTPPGIDPGTVRILLHVLAIILIMYLINDYMCCPITLNLLTTTIVALPSNASKWQMGSNSAFKGLNELKYKAGC
jgi:hypothetical protein